MSTFDTAKEIIRLGSTAGLSKDVIDLLEKKLAIITSALDASTRKNGELDSRILQLETDNANLRKQIQNLQPVGFVDNMGVLWKRTAKGFEPHPYCKECRHHPVMVAMPPGIHPPMVWQCSSRHNAPGSVEPPRA